MASQSLANRIRAVRLEHETLARVDEEISVEKTAPYQHLVTESTSIDDIDLDLFEYASEADTEQQHIALLDDTSMTTDSCGAQHRTLDDGAAVRAVRQRETHPCFCTSQECLDRAGAERRVIRARVDFGLQTEPLGKDLHVLYMADNRLFPLMSRKKW